MRLCFKIDDHLHIYISFIKNNMTPYDLINLLLDRKDILNKKLKLFSKNT